MALTSKQRGWCVLEFHTTNSAVTVQHAFKRKFNVDPPTNESIFKWHRNFIKRGCICDQRKGHSGITAAVNSVTLDMLPRVWSELARLSHRCLPSNKRGAHWVCVIPHETMSFCNCSHQFCMNIPASFDFITIWNQGVFLCSPCIVFNMFRTSKCSSSGRLVHDC